MFSCTAFSTFSRLCDHHHYLSPEHCHHAQTIPHTFPLRNHFPYPLPSGTLATTNLKTNFKKKIYIFLERGEGREKERETSMCGCLSCARPLGTRPATQACAQTWNRTADPPSSQAGTQSTDPHQPGLKTNIFNESIFLLC